MKIYIVGCAKSGTTLLRRLFHAYEGVQIIPREIPIDAFMDAKNSDGVLVGKRSAFTIFSYPLSEGMLAWHKTLISENKDTRVLCIYRDGRDVIESGVPLQRWIASLLQMLYHREAIDLCIRYETLVRHPDTVQTFITNFLKLAPSAKFSEYPSFFPSDEVVASGEKYKPRPISADRIGKNPDAHLTVPEHRTIFRTLLEFMGYL